MRSRIPSSSLLSACAALVLAAGCTPGISPSPDVTSPPAANISVNYTFRIGSNANFDGYLTDGTERTLYYFTHDVIGGSNANSTVTNTWPVFYTASVYSPPELDPLFFSSINRSDGKPQSTYRGWPLYYYVNDKSPGDALGDGVNGSWYVLKVFPLYSVMLMEKPTVGTYLCDPAGKTIYWSANDSPGSSNVQGADLSAWSPVNLNGLFIVPSSINASDFSTITRLDQTFQTTYKGWPLYYSTSDNAPSMMAGQGSGGVWWAVNVSAPGPPGR
jgi:predicted lipoprotein with Yx(FWY)xxD motif